MEGRKRHPGFFSSLLGTLIPFIIIGVLFFFLLNSVQGGGSRVMQFGKSKAKIANKDTPKTTFRDVAGCEEAIEELEEIKEFLAEPAKFQAVGAKIPKGVLLYGPPGTGKTLLARRSPARLGCRSTPSPALISSRCSSVSGPPRSRSVRAGEGERARNRLHRRDRCRRPAPWRRHGRRPRRTRANPQPAAGRDGRLRRTRRRDLDRRHQPAGCPRSRAAAPGRFDRQISVEAPDLRGRFNILKVHAEGKPMAPDVDLEGVARRTPGFTGADLANVLNEAALLTARQNAVDHRRVPRRGDRPRRRRPAEAQPADERQGKAGDRLSRGGHALVAAALPGTDPVQKVTILPRGRALGYTMVLPEQDKYANTRAELLDQLAYMMGGRAAEELVFHDPTTGASNDIEKATALARAMVTQYGMTERLGAIKLGSGDAEPFLGRDIGHGRDYSEEVAAIVDEEVSKLISNAHQEAFDILNENRDVLDDLVRALFEKETLDRDQVAAVFQPLRLWPKRPAWTGSDERIPRRPAGDPPPPSINGQGNGQAGSGQTPSPGQRSRRGHAATSGASAGPSQLPATGDSDPQPQRGPDFR